MNVDLDKEDLTNLVLGTSPNYKLMMTPEIAKLGRYSGSYDKWSWDGHALNKLSEGDLLKLYRKCKKSWIN